MNTIKRLLHYLRWPASLGLIAGLLIALLFPQQLQLYRADTEIPAPRASTEWGGPVSYADAVDRAALAVVNIYTLKQVPAQNNPLLNHPLFRRLFNTADNPRQQRMQSTLGSGVVVDAKGHILTNQHVIDNAVEIVVALQDGREAKALVLGENRERDLAVLKIDLNNLHPITIASGASPRVGDVVLAIGNPFGIGQTVTQGIISATRSRNRDLNISAFEDFIQTDAEIHPGNSGGALIDARGNLLGINTALLSQTGGIGFAIPIEIAMQTLDDIVKFGRVVRGWLGISVRQLSAQTAIQIGLQSGTGFLVTATSSNGPAERGGIVPGDIIIGLTKSPLQDERDLAQLILEARPGQAIAVDLIREGQLLSLKVIPEERPADR